jgi:protein O-GlcNAc transferase
MSLFDRIRLGVRRREETPRGTAVMSEQDPLRLIDKGNAAEDEGRFQDALERYDAAIRLAPKLARAHLNRGNALLALGHPEAASGAYATALVHDPDYSAAYYNLGNAYVRSNRREDALVAYRRALALTSDFADAEVALGGLHEEFGQREEAVARYRRALQINPAYAVVHGNLGNVLQDLGQVEEAIVCFRRALELDPQLDMARFGLGNALQGLGQSEDAVVSFRRVLQSNPDFALAHGNLGNALQALGKNDEAIECYRRALQIAPHEAVIQINLANALRSGGKIHESLAIFRRAVEIAPDLAIAHYNLGNALNDLAQKQEAVASYRNALRLDPNLVNAHWMLGNLLMEDGHLQEALACYRRMLEIEPRNAMAHNNMGNVFKRLGQLPDAVASYQLALEINPDLAAAHSNLLYIYNALADQTPATLLAEARLFGELAARQAHPFTTWSNPPAPDRTLRIGLVSGDLRSHPVGYFIESVLAALAFKARHRLEVYVYSNHAFVDIVSARIKESCRAWCLVAHLTDKALAERIRDDGIDILIDLSGHTAFNRLKVFAWKPAPVQVSWLGYFATTGVAEIDYLIADPWTLPISEEINFAERIWRLPETRLCFTPPDEDVAVAPLAAVSNGCVTFGSFNHVGKMNDAVIALWARVLAAVPDSRLFLKFNPIQDVSARQRISERFAVHGVPAKRLILESDESRAKYFAAYHRVDIALDPFPFPGGTTTVEGLWMGVPVLTLGGKSFLSRQGVGLLMNAGLPDWIAADADDYVDRAVFHAGDLPRLAVLREGLRQQILASPLFDAPRFARNFDAALRDMWQKWCAQQRAPAE